VSYGPENTVRDIYDGTDYCNIECFLLFGTIYRISQPIRHTVIPQKM